MNLRRIPLLIALSGVVFAGCGDDDASGEPQQPDSGLPPAGEVASDGSVKDAATSDGSVFTKDSGALHDASAKDAGRDASSTDGSAADGGKADSAVPGGDSGTGPSEACTACTASECVASKYPLTTYEFKRCADFGNETAMDGRKVGMPRAALCESVVSCIYRTGCGNPLVKPAAKSGDIPYSDVFACLCGTLGADACIGAEVSEFDGPCAAVMIDAAETTDAQTVLERWFERTYPLGTADSYVQCQQLVCADECFAPCAGQSDGRYCAGIVGANGETSGAANDPGTCSAMKCLDSPDTIMF